MLNGKTMIIVGLIKRVMSKYFPEPKSLGGRVKVELDLSNYETKADLKNATDDDTSKFSTNVDLANLKSDIYIN